MSSANIKLLSSILVAIGVGLCATFGAQVTPNTMTSLSQELSKSAASKSAITHPATSTVEAPLDRLSSWWSMSALPFSGGLALIIIGSLMARKQQALELEDSPSDTENTGQVNLEQSLTEMHAILQATLQLFNEEELDQSSLLAKVKIEIENIQKDLLDPIIEQRDRLRARMGTGHFIDVFGPIASGERKLNRAWAACVDEHRTEVQQSLNQAHESFATALNLNTQKDV